MTNDATTTTTTDVGEAMTEFDLGSTIEALKALPPRRNGKDLKETISSLAPALRRAKKQGYTIPELAAWLKGRGLEIGPTTLRQYLPKESPKKARTRKTPPAGVAPVTQVSAAPAQPAPAPTVTAPMPTPPGVINKPAYQTGQLVPKR